MVDLELGVCPLCGSVNCREISTEGGDYNENDQSVVTVVLYHCNMCGSKFRELRYYGTVVISQGYYDEDGDEDDYTMFYGIPAAEYLDRLMRDPASCKTPSEVRAEREAKKIRQEHDRMDPYVTRDIDALGSSSGYRDIDFVEDTPGYRDIDNLGSNTGHRDIDFPDSWDKKPRKSKKKAPAKKPVQKTNEVGSYIRSLFVAEESPKGRKKKSPSS